MRFAFFFKRKQMVADSVLALDFLLKLRRIDGMKPGGLYNLSLRAYSQVNQPLFLYFNAGRVVISAKHF